MKVSKNFLFCSIWNEVTPLLNLCSPRIALLSDRLICFHIPHSIICRRIWKLYCSASKSVLSVLLQFEQEPYFSNIHSRGFIVSQFVNTISIHENHPLWELFDRREHRRVPQLSCESCDLKFSLSKLLPQLVIYSFLCNSIFDKLFIIHFFIYRSAILAPMNCINKALLFFSSVLFHSILTHRFY